MLTVDFSSQPECDPGVGVSSAKVSWNANAAKTEGIEIWLQSPGEEKKLWSASGAVGSSLTGPWLREGSTITLVNGVNDQTLASISIPGNTCID